MFRGIVEDLITTTLREISDNLSSLQNPIAAQISEAFHGPITNAYQSIKVRVNAENRGLPHREKRALLTKSKHRLFRQLSLKFYFARQAGDGELFAIKLKQLITQYRMDGEIINAIPQQVLESCRNKFFLRDFLNNPTIFSQEIFTQYERLFENGLNQYERYHWSIDMIISTAQGLLNISSFIAIGGTLLFIAITNTILHRINFLVFQLLNTITRGEYTRQLQAEVAEENIIQEVHDQMSIMGIDSEDTDKDVITNFIQLKNNKPIMDACNKMDEDFDELTPEEKQEIERRARAQLEENGTLVTEESIREQIGQKIKKNIAWFTHFRLVYNALYQQLTAPYPDGAYTIGASFLLRVVQGAMALPLLMLGMMTQTTRVTLAMMFNTVFCANLALNIVFTVFALLPLHIYDGVSYLGITRLFPQTLHIYDAASYLGITWLLTRGAREPTIHPERGAEATRSDSEQQVSANTRRKYRSKQHTLAPVPHEHIESEARKAKTALYGQKSAMSAQEEARRLQLFYPELELNSPNAGHSVRAEDEHVSDDDDDAIHSLNLIA